MLDSTNGVSSTRSTSVAAIDIQEGEVRQLQFFENTLMALWSYQNGPTYLLDIPFQPISAQSQPDNISPVVPACDFTATDHIPTSEKPAVQPATLSLEAMNENDMVRHVFAASGLKSKPVQLNFYGRKGRKAVCVLYGDAMRYEVLDLDAAVEEDEDEEEEDEDEE